MPELDTAKHYVKQDELVSLEARHLGTRDFLVSHHNTNLESNCHKRSAERQLLAQDFAVVPVI